MLSLPAFMFGLFLSTLYGAVFHLWRGGGAGRLLLYLILGWVGFWSGHFVAALLGWSFGDLGTLHILPATFGSVLFLAGGYWLSLVEVERK